MTGAPLGGSPGWLKPDQGLRCASRLRIELSRFDDDLVELHLLTAQGQPFAAVCLDREGARAVAGDILVLLCAHAA